MSDDLVSIGKKELKGFIWEFLTTKFGPVNKWDGEFLRIVLGYGGPDEFVSFLIPHFRRGVAGKFIRGTGTYYSSKFKLLPALKNEGEFIGKLTGDFDDFLEYLRSGKLPREIFFGKKTKEVFPSNRKPMVSGDYHRHLMNQWNKDPASVRGKCFKCGRVASLTMRENDGEIQFLCGELDARQKRENRKLTRKGKPKLYYHCLEVVRNVGLIEIDHAAESKAYNNEVFPKVWEENKKFKTQPNYGKFEDLKNDPQIWLGRTSPLKTPSRPEMELKSIMNGLERKRLSKDPFWKKEFEEERERMEALKTGGEDVVGT